MIVYSVLDIELVDFETFEFYEGGEAFSKEFSEFAQSRLRFKFVDKESLSSAKEQLKKYNLNYKELFGIILESKNELIEYPIVLVAFNTQPKLLTVKDNGYDIDISLASSQFNKDLDTGKLVLRSKAKLFMETQNINISFSKIENLEETFYVIETIENMKYPMTYDEKYKVKKVKLNDIEYSEIENPDGKINFTTNSLEEIKEGVFKKMNSFSYKKEVLKTAQTRYVTTGKFAFEIKQNFNLAENKISLIIPTLNYV